MVNKVILVGNVGKDPEVKYLENGTAFARFTLATSETFKDKEGNRTTKTEWHNIVLWRGLAEVAEKYVKKGHPLYIEGKITNRSYEQDGVTKFFTEIVGNEMKMLGSKSSNEGSSSGSGSTSTHAPQMTESQNTGEVSEPLETDDLPF
jgi:single-strand DNA-binding protein